MDVNALRDEDRQDFEKRLANYGLTPSSLLTTQLHTVPSTITPLYHGPGVASAFKPIVLKTADFSDVNKWIGVPDSVFENRADPVTPPARLSFSGVDMRRSNIEIPLADALQKIKRKDLSSEQILNIRTAARAYLRGDSRKLQDFKPWIEKVYPTIDVVVWPLLEIVVKSGSVLEFGPGPHVLVAYSLTVEEGGVVRSYGHLKIDVTVFKKQSNLTGVVTTLNPALLARVTL